jgi:hypothetical protein
MIDAKYGPETRDFLRATKAHVVVTLVIDGRRGVGMSVASQGVALNAAETAALLRVMANNLMAAHQDGERFDVIVEPLKRDRH